MEKKLFVSTKDESPRLFQSDFMDFFSRIPFWVPLLIFLPVIAYFSYAALFVYPTGIVWFLLLFIGGALTWSVSEYIIHRFVFHFHPEGAFMKRIHFVFHGIHHDYPQDSLRLVMPPAVSVPLAVIFYGLFYFLFGLFDATCLVAAFFAGFVSGYLFYDMMHYATHHLNFKNRYFQMVKEHHMKHHYKDPDAGFGFTSKLWDRVFHTDFQN